MKDFSFYAYYNELIWQNSIYTQHVQLIHQILYGNAKLKTHSSVTCSKIRDKKGHKFTTNQLYYKDYCGIDSPSLDEKAYYMKGLNLHTLPESGPALAEQLVSKDYYLSQNVYKKLSEEPDIYKALVILLEGVMNNECLISMQEQTDTISSKNKTEVSLHVELGKAIEAQRNNSEYPLNVFKTPIGWYINLIVRFTKTSTTDIAERTSMSRPQFMRKTTPDINCSCNLFLSDIQEICAALNTSISSILYCYENKNYFEKNPKDIEYFCHAIQQDNTSNIHARNEGYSHLITNPKNPLFRKWINKKFFCYFSSTNSVESKSEKKEYADTKLLDDTYSDLYKVFSTDHIYSGILSFEEKADPIVPTSTQCIATFRFLVNPEKNFVKKYSGPVVISDSDDKQALFIQLFYNDEITFMILNNPKGNPKHLLASVLTLSSKEDQHTPCAERMFMSKEMIVPNSSAYKYMRSHLLMHDSHIRIDSFGYDLLVKDLVDLNTDDARSILAKYGQLQDLKKMDTLEYQVTIRELAYIKDLLVDHSGLSAQQRILFETLLRYHSIAPWYSKVNDSKIPKLKTTIREQNS